MARVLRVLSVIVSCFLLFFSTAPAAKASVPASPFLAGQTLASYYSKYNLPGSSGTTRPTIPTTPQQPTTPTTPTQPTPTTPTQQAPQPTTPPAPDNSQQNTSGLTADEKLMFELVNQERSKAGLHPFTVDMRLVNLARQKSQDMYQNNYFSHTSPTLGTALDMEKKAGISARVMGAENIAKAATTQRAHALFMGSDGHRANIMNSLHDAIGIGIIKSQYGVIVTQLFIGD